MGVKMYKDGKTDLIMHEYGKMGRVTNLLMSRQMTAQLAPFVLRLVVGVIFLVHGLSKVAHVASTVAGFTRLGVPLPGLAGPAIALLEVLGGLVLILGLGVVTRILALLLAIEMLYAILLVKLHAGLVGGYEFELLLLAASLALVFSGPGYLSIVREQASM